MDGRNRIGIVQQIAQALLAARPTRCATATSADSWGGGLGWEHSSRCCSADGIRPPTSDSPSTSAEQRTSAPVVVAPNQPAGIGYNRWRRAATNDPRLQTAVPVPTIAELRELLGGRRVSWAGHAGRAAGRGRCGGLPPSERQVCQRENVFAEIPAPSWSHGGRVRGAHPRRARGGLTGGRSRGVGC